MRAANCLSRIYPYIRFYNSFLNLEIGGLSSEISRTRCSLDRLLLSGIRAEEAAQEDAGHPIYVFGLWRTHKGTLYLYW